MNYGCDNMSKLILASSSPRRKEILDKYNINFSIVPSHIQENTHIGETPEQITMALAYEKALNVENRLKDNEIIIAADTIVCFENNILGKPKDFIEAFNMLKMLSGRSHHVITGIAILKVNSNIKVIDYEKTKVVFRQLTDNKIENYLEMKEYRDKAGAYAIQGIGEVLVERIEGCYSNVVGLPITKLDMLLEKHFNISLL